MLASQGIGSIPGGWGKDLPAHGRPTYDDIDDDTSDRDLATGIVSEAGEVVNQSGKAVGKITEGEPKDLAGNVVTATGDIVGKTGDVVGHALPLDNVTGSDSDDTVKRGGWTVIGTVQSVTDVVGNVAGGATGAVGNVLGGTVETVGSVPGQLTKGLGLGGRSMGGDSEKASESVADDEQSTTDQPAINLEDKEEKSEGAVEEAKDVAEDKAGDITSSADPKDTPAETDESKPEVPAIPEESGDTPAVPEAKAEATDIPEEVKDTADDAQIDVAKDIEEKPEDLKSTAPDVEEKAEDIKSTADDAEPAVDALAAPFEKFDDLVVDESGKVIADDRTIGEVVDGDPADLVGKTVNAEGEILNDNGSVVGKVEPTDELKEELTKTVDFSVLKGAKVNKAGNLVDDKGAVVGHITEGILKKLVGKKCDENGQFWDDTGKVIGKAEPIPESEREEYREGAPFEDFPDAIVQSNGDVVFGEEVIGKVIEGDPKAMKGKKVDADGDILDKNGNVIGKAERWEAPEAEPEAVKDQSILAGKRVNKAGNVVDGQGTIFGRLVEGDPKRLAGRMCDKDGNVRSESGDIIGKAEAVPEGEREGAKDGPFAELAGCSVAKDGKVVTPAGDVVGRIISGDAKALFGRQVDEDGDILDKNGNSIGKAERWEEPEVEKKKGPMAGRRVNREGNVVDEDGNLIGKLTTGELTICGGKEIDDDGDVVNSKGQTIGHVSLLSEIPPEPEVGETPEEKEKREQLEKDKELAKRIASCVEQSLDRIRPICKMITQKIEKAERTPKEDLDEEELVKEVKPLLEEGGKILQEANGVIRGLDPDGRIQANAKHKTAQRDASPEEYHLADVLKELTGTITECIDGAKRKIEDMPHAKKELNPLWGLLTEPLFQILAAVGLLLNGVLSLVGRLLSGLGLGGLVDNLLGGLGIKRVLESLGVGSLTDALTGKQGKKKK